VRNWVTILWLSSDGPRLWTLFGSLVGASIILIGLVILAIVVTPMFLIGIAIYVGVRLWLESPARLERLAYEETLQLHRHAQAGRVVLSEDEIDAQLSAAWPPTMPEALREQLLEIGRALFEAEGLNPEIPPIPALCNTIEGGRYRDLLARLGEARNDRNMLLAALGTLSDALAPVAKAAPPMEGDVLVPVAQFLTPLGPSIDAIVSPFFQDSGYNHFKALREQLDHNLRQTHRTNPIYPADYKGDDAVATYLSGTLLAKLFDLRTPFAIPEELRFEHTHIVAGSGHGKTQTLQYLIAHDLVDVAAGDKSVVVIDS